MFLALFCKETTIKYIFVQCLTSNIYLELNQRPQGDQIMIDHCCDFCVAVLPTYTTLFLFFLQCNDISTTHKNTATERTTTYKNTTTKRTATLMSSL